VRSRSVSGPPPRSRELTVESTPRHYNVLRDGNPAKGKQHAGRFESPFRNCFDKIAAPYASPMSESRVVTLSFGNSQEVSLDAGGRSTSEFVAVLEERKLAGARLLSDGVREIPVEGGDVQSYADAVAAWIIRVANLS
jgi:hypothetical protein